MCDFCTKHGEGQKWYLTMSNYSRELLAQQGREQFIDDFTAHFEEKYGLGAAKVAVLMDRIKSLPLVHRIVGWLGVKSSRPA